MHTLVKVILLSSILFPAYAAVPRRQSARQASTTEIEAYLQEQSNAGFTGTVLVARKGKVVLNKTYGAASKLGYEPAFWIASNSKSFVAAAILKLRERGKLSVSDPLSKFFKDVPADKQLITVHHLLTHTSGLPHRYAADGVADREQAVRSILALPLEQKVGEGYLYSNDGYNLLAAIVEVASKRPFEDFMRAEIFKPAGLRRAGLWGHEGEARLAPAANPRVTQNVRATIYQNGKSVSNWGYRGATGVFSTAEDLYNWMSALRQDKVLNAKSREQLWGKQVLARRISAEEEQYYGYGWAVRYKGGKRLFVRHTGNEDWLGHNSVMSLDESGDAIVVLSNGGEKDGGGWSTFILRELQKRLQT